MSANLAPVPSTAQLPPRLAEELVYFFQQYAPQQLNNQLRCLVLEYLQLTLPKGVPYYVQELLPALNSLLDLLEMAGKVERVS